MAAGLQCPGCGHVHPAGLPEIARGDATFRCYGCYRTLSVPEGWSGRPTPRPGSAAAAASGGAAGAPAGAGTRDARRARLSGRGRGWRDPGPESSTGAVSGAGAAGAGAAGLAGGAAAGGDATQMVPAAGRDGLAGLSAWSSGSGAGARPPPVDAAHPPLVDGAAPASGESRAPLGWVAPRRSGRPVPAAIRALVWTVAFALAFVVTVLGLKEVGVLGVNTAIDLYAGTGVHRFGVLLVMLPVWALLSAVIAHFTLEALARRRRPRPATRRSAATPSSPA